MTLLDLSAAKVFDEWARRYADDPRGFSETLNDAGRPVVDYGERCVVYFNLLVKELG